jgi:aryl-alcohol dehydrogenase-like predicted oxidoreductase
VRTVPLGNSGVKVSVCCLGAMRLGWATDPVTSYRLLDRYVDAGGSFVDTANIYGREGGQRVGGISETLLGKWMRERRNRLKLFIATKVGFDYAGAKRGLRAHQIEEECDKSLERLGINTIDLYYAHVDDRNTSMVETLGAFERLVRVGKVRLIGASNFLAWRLETARWVSQTNGWAEYCCVQQRHSFIRPKPGADFAPQIVANDDLLDYCRARGMTMLAYSPLLSGAYTRDDRTFGEQYLGPDTDARLSALREVAGELGVTLNQVVLAWMVQSGPPVIPLVAASTLEQMDENLGALEIQLSVEHMVRLNRASA